MEKTLKFNAPFGEEEVKLVVANYANNNRLYIGLLSRDEDDPDFFEPFDDLTVNLTVADLKNPNEAFIDNNFSREKIQFIEKNKLGKVIPVTFQSGFCTFQAVAFDIERLREFAPEGVEEFLKMRGVKRERRIYRFHVRKGYPETNGTTDRDATRSGQRETD